MNTTFRSTNMGKTGMDPGPLNNTMQMTFSKERLVNRTENNRESLQKTISGNAYGIQPPIVQIETKFMKKYSKLTPQEAKMQALQILKR